VPTPKLRIAASPVDVPAGDRACLFRPVVVLGHREYQAVRTAAGARRIAVPALHDIPAVVFTPGARPGRIVDLLPVLQAEVGDAKITGLPVVGEPPRIAQAVGPDLGPGVPAAHEGVVRRDRVRLSPVHVDPEHLSQQAREDLSVPPRIARPSAIADVQLTGLPVEDRPTLHARAVGPDLGPGVPEAHEGVVRRVRVRLSPVHVDPDQLSLQARKVLSVPPRIARPATVAGPDVT